MVWLAAADRGVTPMLGAQEEYLLARRGGGDREAAHALVPSHLRLVVKIAMSYRGYGLPISERRHVAARAEARAETPALG